MSNIDKVIKSVKNLQNIVNSNIVNKKINEDDKKYLIIKSEQYIEDLEMIKFSLKFNEELKEKDFKEVIIHINDFSKSAKELIKI